MRIQRPQDVHYLALEGGGGKGVAYLGAVRALERLGVLPIDLSRRGNNQIRGLSGASAGAITALMLAMGMNSTQLGNMLGRASTFTGFFDGPDPGLYRSVNARNQPDLHTDAPPNTVPLTFIRQRAQSIANWRQLVRIVGVLGRSGAFGATTDPMVSKMLSDPEAFLYNLIFDRGLFPGFAPRSFLGGAIAGALSRQILGLTGGVIVSGLTGGNVSFDLFYRMTGVDLVITGANVTKQRPALFSRRHTPDFPVAEAVGISMNLPLIFKPVLVEADVPVGPLHGAADDYHGLWVDGGLLNNLPLHAFDHLTPALSSAHPNLRPLHPNMLGLRLTEGPNPPRHTGGSGTFSILFEHLGHVMNTALYPSEQGQIRSAGEAEQTIDLYTYDLATTNFAPAPSVRATPEREAQRAVYRYFGLPPSGP